jgi:hypothetical protein
LAGKKYDIGIFHFIESSRPDLTKTNNTIIYCELVKIDNELERGFYYQQNILETFEFVRVSHKFIGLKKLIGRIEVVVCENSHKQSSSYRIFSPAAAYSFLHEFPVRRK